tara:strand:- start:437475 stop:437600 length:126 start_codon:yes stop_codon:yes gene_type:complete
MLHIVKLIRHYHPHNAEKIIRLLVLASAVLLVAGIGLFLLQ